MHPEPDVTRRWVGALREAATHAYAASHGTEPPVARATRWRIDARTAVSAGVVILVVAAWAWWGLRTDGAPTAVIAASASPSMEPSAAAAVVVHVSGRVGTPGLVTLPSGARVADAVAAAGGMTDDADESSVNLARRVSDGEHLVVRAPGEGDGPALVNLNLADATALERLPGVGPVLAARIVADREAQGPFLTLDDLTRVSGVGPAIIAGLPGVATV